MSAGEEPPCRVLPVHDDWLLLLCQLRDAGLPLTVAAARAGVGEATGAATFVVRLCSGHMIAVVARRVLQLTVCCGARLWCACAVCASRSVCC